MLSISAVKEKTHSKGVPQTAFYGSVSRFVSSWSLLKRILFFLSWNVIVSLQCLDPGVQWRNAGPINPFAHWATRRAFKLFSKANEITP